MIQRIQSIYLTLALVFSIVLFWVPLSLIMPLPEAENAFPYKLDVFGITHLENQQTILDQEAIPLLSLLAIISFLILVIIFLFKNRPVQYKLGRLTMLLVLVFVFLIFYYSDQMKLLSGTGESPAYVVGTYLPLVIILMLFFAVRAIKKDETMVRSAERLR